MAGEDPDYVRWVRSRGCLLAGTCGTWRGVEAHHAGRRGLGQRAHDSTCIPLCREHHSAWHDARPPFRGWTPSQRQEWAEEAIGRIRALYAAALAEPTIPF